MSDGITDAYRDSRRAELYGEWLHSVILFLRSPCDVNKTKVHEAAENCDGVPIGLITGCTNLALSVDDLLQKLIDKDEHVWLKFLYRNNDKLGYNDLKSLSPYKDKILMVRYYGRGFARMEGDEGIWCDEVIREEGMATYDCDSYVLILDKPKIDKVHWLSGSEKTPFRKDRTRK